MKRISNKLLIILFLTSMIFPVISSSNVKAQTIPRFTVGVNGIEGNWDPTSFVISAGVWFQFGGALETFFYPPDGWDGDYANIHPGLAESWTIHNRTDTMNDKGFISRGGISKITMDLRENVTFHDGSDWNATVAKWNIDRIFYVSGNLTGETPNDANVMSNRNNRWWINAANDASFATLDGSWNTSKFLNTMPMYDGLMTQDNPAKTGFWGYYPRVKNVTIVDDQQSGGIIDIYYNDWGIGAPYYFWTEYFGIISMEAYKDYKGKPIFGYGGHPDYPQDHTFQHLIGTGPYKFVNFDPVVLEGGSMVRNDEYWNATALQAEGYHMVKDVSIVTFPQSNAGFSTRNNAMVTGDLDLCLDNAYEPLVYNDMIMSPDVNYVERPVAAFGENIMLNCINETYLKAWSEGIPFPANSTELGWWYPLVDNDVGWTAGGVNRAFRKAVSYAFNYDSYINTAKNGRVVRSGGFVGVTSPLYNSGIDIAYRDLTIARQALLDDPIWGAQCAARHLDIDNTTQEWRNVAEGSDPIYKMEHAWDDTLTDSTIVLTESLKDIGIARDTSNYFLHLVPNWYDTMTVTYTFPWFTYDSATVRWTLTRNGATGYLAAYYKSPGVVEHNAYGYPIADYNDYGTFSAPFWPSGAFYNMGFSYNSTMDYWLERVNYENLTGQQEFYDNMADWAQNYQYPFIYLGQRKSGDAINTDWEYRRASEAISFSLVKYVGSQQPAIPGFTVDIMIATSLVAMIGIIYMIKRKSKQL